MCPALDASSSELIGVITSPAATPAWYANRHGIPAGTVSLPGAHVLARPTSAGWSYAVESTLSSLCTKHAVTGPHRGRLRGTGVCCEYCTHCAHRAGVKCGALEARRAQRGGNGLPPRLLNAVDVDHADGDLDVHVGEPRAHLAAQPAHDDEGNCGTQRQLPMGTAVAKPLTNR